MDKRHGFADHRYANGDQYIGEWSEDNQHGNGRLVFKNGEVRDRVWVNGTETDTPCDAENAVIKAKKGR